MKKMIAVFLAVLMLVSLAACGLQAEAKAVEPNKTVTESETIVGGFTAPGSPVVTDDVKALLQKATESLAGTTYIPVAFLGTQVVAGTNYLILCKTVPITPDAKGIYALVTLYEDLTGHVVISEVRESFAQTPVTADDGSALSGGYTEAQNPEVTAEAKAALNKACDGLCGASYEAAALLGTQVVSGTNYSLLCKITPVAPHAASKYVVVTVYEDLNGSAEITENYDFA